MPAPGALWPTIRAVGLTGFVFVLLLAPAASASITQEEQRGSEVLRRIEGGQTSCAQAGAAGFEQIGEYVMGRMLGSPSLHRVMNARLTDVLGPQGEERMHQAMGERFSGCGTGSVPRRFGRVMGTMGLMMGGISRDRSERYAGGMMGQGRGPGAMAGFGHGRFDPGHGSSGAWMIAAAILLVGAAIAVVLARTRGSS